MKKIKSLFKWYIAPLLLIALWIALSLFFNPYLNFGTLTHAHSAKDSQINSPDKLLIGNTITGQFRATENNLGIMSIRFKPVKRVDTYKEDSLIFQIREKGSKVPFFESKYKSGLFYDKSLFPFGFPKIVNSEGKIYEFSLTSKNGNGKNALSISKNNPVLISNYVFSKKQLISDKKLLVKFIFKKILTLFTDMEFFISSTIYLLPLLFYISFNLAFKNARFNRYYFLIITPLLMVWATLADRGAASGIFFGLAGLWAITAMLYNLESSVSFLFAFFFFILSLIQVLLNSQTIGGGLSEWIYVFLLVGAFQVIWEIKKQKKRITYKDILKSLPFIGDSKTAIRTNIKAPKK